MRSREGTGPFKKELASRFPPVLSGSHRSGEWARVLEEFKGFEQEVARTLMRSSENSISHPCK